MRFTNDFITFLGGLLGLGEGDGVGFVPFPQFP
jgi:hypothetical protein